MPDARATPAVVTGRLVFDSDKSEDVLLEFLVDIPHWDVAAIDLRDRWLAVTAAALGDQYARAKHAQNEDDCNLPHDGGALAAPAGLTRVLLLFSRLICSRSLCASRKRGASSRALRTWRFAAGSRFSCNSFASRKCARAGSGGSSNSSLRQAAMARSASSSASALSASDAYGRGTKGLTARNRWALRRASSQSLDASASSMRRSKVSISSASIPATVESTCRSSLVSPSWRCAYASIT